MKVGLVRHFKAKKPFPQTFLITQKELFQWFEEYKDSDIEDGEIDLCGITWKRCFTSDLLRAEKTAKKIYNENFIKMEKLREIQPAPLFRRNVKMPLFLWAALIRVTWLINHKSQKQNKQNVLERIGAVLDEILSLEGEDVLVVTHGALMIFIRKELVKRGFKGPRLKTPANGKVYIYDNNELPGFS
jgi:broad specificity phosphatase PhoE